MTTTTHGTASGGSLARLLLVIGRHKLLVLLPTLVLLGLAIAHSSSQSPLYKGQADVLLSRTNLQSMISNQPAIGITSDQFFRIQKTQASLVQSPAVARQVLARAHVRDLTPKQLLARTTVDPDRSRDLLHFEVADPSPKRAELLSRAFARQYVEYRRQLDTAAIQIARGRIQQALKNLNPNDPTTRKTAQSLTATAEQLTTLEALQSGNATYVSSDANVTKVRPRLVRDAILAALLGLALGVGLAFLREALDTRVRTPDEVGDVLDLPFLGYLPPPPRKGPLPMLDAPSSPAAEAYRKLAMNLQFTNLGPKAQSIVVSSAVDGEGKSVTISNLAVALARSGRRVALVDLDLRKATIHTLFGVPNDRGITDVVLGETSLADVRHVIEIAPGAESSRLQPSRDGELVVFPGGPLPPDPAEFLASAEVNDVIRRLTAGFDFVLFDAPPLLRVGDPLTLSSQVDAMFLVARIGSVNRPALRELERALQNAPVSLLGFTATGSGAWVKSHGLHGDGYGYGDGTPGSTYRGGNGTRASGRTRQEPLRSE